MERLIFDILEEPKGEIYQGLLDYAIAYCETALLVVGHHSKFSTAGQHVLQALSPFLKHEVESHEWPGTRMLWDTALVLQYQYGPELATILKGAADRLYSWQQPDLPEDLSLLRQDGEPWLVTIAHENDSYLKLSREELEHLFEALPAFRSMVKERVDSSSAGRV